MSKLNEISTGILSFILVSCTISNGLDSETTSGDTARYTTAQAAPNNIIALHYKNGDPWNNQPEWIKPHFRLENVSDQDIPLQEISVRYWFVNETYPSPQILAVDIIQSEDTWQSPGNFTNQCVKGTFGPVIQGENADTWLDICFTDVAGILKPGNFLKVEAAFHAENWSKYSESNDYSLKINALNYSLWDHLTVYRNGHLIWGVEPVQYSVMKASLNPGAYIVHSVTGPYAGLQDANGNSIGNWDDPAAFDRPDHNEADLIWFSSGFVSYDFTPALPAEISLIKLQFTAEIASEYMGANWNWPSDIQFVLNQVTAGSWIIPGDPNEQYGFGRQENHFDWFNTTQYGWFITLTVDKQGTWLEYLFRLGNMSKTKISDVTIDTLAIDPTRAISVKLLVPYEDQNPIGGLNIFGDTWGDYDIDPTLTVYFKPIAPVAH